MRAIGFNNFRKFKSFPVMELSPITIFVGGNNAGKSTVVKAMISLVTFLRESKFDTVGDQKSVLKNKFYFNEKYTHIGTFKRALYNKAENKTISFQAQIEEFMFEVEMNGDDSNDNTTYANVTRLRVKNLNSLISYDFNFLKDTISMSFEDNRSLLLDNPRYKLLSESIKQCEAEIASKRRVSVNRIHIGRYRHQLKEEFPVVDIPFTLEAQLSKISRRFMLSGPLVTGLIYNLISYYADEIDDLGDFDDLDDLDENPIVHKEEIMKLKRLNGLLPYLYKTRRRLDQMIVYSPLIEYIYAHSASQMVLYNSNETNDYLVQTIHAFAEAKAYEDEASREFIRKWMRRFSIGEDFRLNTIQGEAHTLEIKEGTDFIPLADKGMGSIQLMILLFRLSLDINNNQRRLRNFFPTTIIVEEPEQNLHPRVQSELMDFFYEVSAEHNFRFVIETHSEYMIRRSQVIVAMKQYSSLTELNKCCPFKVIYFPEDEKPYNMEYQVNGRFARPFGSGFFDEATMSSFTLSKIERGLLK